MTDDHQTQKRRVRTWIDIDRKSIAYNYRLFRKMIGKETEMLAVVKSNAYGHSLVDFAKEQVALGVDWLGVDSLVEALTLRKEGVGKTPILVLGYTLPDMLDDARAKRVSVSVSNFATLKEVTELPPSKHKLRVHLKVDTGMHRQGFLPEDLPKVIRLLTKLPPSVVVEGLYTHFAEAKNPKEGESTRAQIARFQVWVDALREAGYAGLLVHAGATGGTLLYPEGHFGMVRVGIGLYGLWPSTDAREHLEGQVSLRPVLSWRAVVGEVKRIAKGSAVGYDGTEVVMRNTITAVIPVGYWHGYPRLLSGRGRVLIHGKSAKILGRVSMDMIVVDVTDIPGVKAGDVVTLIGKSGKEEIPASEIADLAGTTHYEIVTRLNPRTRRFLV